MYGKNPWLVAYEPVEVQDFKKVTEHLRIISRIYIKWIKQNQKMWTCNRLDLESLESWPTMPKNFPDTDQEEEVSRWAHIWEDENS